jgi:hypothetical protein
VVYGNKPGQEIEYPMAVVILGGLATSTLLNLFVLPALYLRVVGWRRSLFIPNGLVMTPARPGPRDRGTARPRLWPASPRAAGPRQLGRRWPAAAGPPLARGGWPAAGPRGPRRLAP